MVDQMTFKNFEDIYSKTYSNVLKFIICKCSNLDDVNDIIQETYIEVYKKLVKGKSIDEKYIFGIAKNKLKKHYHILLKIHATSLFKETDDGLEMIDKISDDIDIEQIILEKCDVEFIWDYLKKKKIEIQKIFYLYYYLDITIKEISQELTISESCVKNSLYRTLKELQKVLRKDCDGCVK